MRVFKVTFRSDHDNSKFDDETVLAKTGAEAIEKVVKANRYADNKDIKLYVGDVEFITEITV